MSSLPNYNRTLEDDAELFSFDDDQPRGRRKPFIIGVCGGTSRVDLWYLSSLE